MGIFGGGGGQKEKPVPPEDPEMIAQRQNARMRADMAAERSADASTSQSLGRAMGTRGARALFTANQSGYARTLGSGHLSHTAQAP